MVATLFAPGAIGAVESYTGVDFDLLKNSWTIGSTVHNDGTIHGGVKLEM